jgi:predicted phosphodiesterase
VMGVISDTHRLLRPEAEQRLAGVAHIVHAGDIGRPTSSSDSAGLRV